MKNFLRKVRDRLWSILKGTVQQKKLYIRLPICVFAVIVMGFCLSWLLMVDWGVDPCTAMNQAIASKLNMSIGDWQAIFNSVLFVVVIIFGNNDIGFGTLANMFLVGYSIDFFSWIWKLYLPANFMDPLGVRIAVFAIALIVFIIAAALYMDMKLGTSPYDAISFIIHQKLFKKIPFRFVRMAYDCIVIGIALAFGSQSIGIVTVVIALFLGTVIELLGKLIGKWIEF